jgi:hypothetical protein
MGSFHCPPGLVFGDETVLPLSALHLQERQERDQIEAKVKRPRGYMGPDAI